jgi:hypothetical protein
MSPGDDIMIKCAACGNPITGTHYEVVIYKNDSTSGKVGKVIKKQKYCNECYNK